MLQYWIDITFGEKNITQPLNLPRCPALHRVLPYDLHFRLCRKLHCEGANIVIQFSPPSPPQGVKGLNQCSHITLVMAH